MGKNIFSFTIITISTLFLSGCSIADQVSFRQNISQSGLLYSAVKPYIQTGKVQGDSILSLKPTFPKSVKESDKRIEEKKKEEDKKKTSTTRNPDLDKANSTTAETDKKEVSVSEQQTQALDKAITEQNTQVAKQQGTDSNQNIVMQNLNTADKPITVGKIGSGDLKTVLASLSKINESFQKQLDGMEHSVSNLSEVAVDNTTFTTQKERLLKLFETKKAAIVQVQESIKAFSVAPSYTSQDLMITRLQRDYITYIQTDLLIDEIIDSWE